MKDNTPKAATNGQSRKAVKNGAGRQPGRAKADKLAAEIAHYRARLADNEERLFSNKASDGTPLTELQRTNLEEIIARQRQRLLELSA